MPDITLSLTVDETNLVLTALAELPFKVSQGLITKIQTVANSQLNPKTEGE